MFDGVARRYDLTNTVLSLGQDRFWRRATRSALQIGPGDKVLDLAAGTAVSTVELAASGAWCVAADFSVGMLAAGAGRDVPKVAGDATRLPFADGVFDAVTISFGLRNVVDHVAGLREMARVTRPGGRLVVCEFSTPTNALFAHRLQGVPDAGAAADGARGVVESRTPTCIWPSRSARGPTRRRSRIGSPTQAGRRCGGATSPAASSRCTPPPNPRAKVVEMHGRLADPNCTIGTDPRADPRMVEGARAVRPRRPHARAAGVGRRAARRPARRRDSDGESDGHRPRVVGPDAARRRGHRHHDDDHHWRRRQRHRAVHHPSHRRPAEHCPVWCTSTAAGWPSTA